MPDSNINQQKKTINFNDLSETEFQALFEAIRNKTVSLGYHYDKLIELDDIIIKLPYPIVIEESKDNNRLHITLLEDMKAIEEINLGRKQKKNNIVLSRSARITCLWDQNNQQTISLHLPKDVRPTHHTQLKMGKSLKHQTLYKRLDILQHTPAKDKKREGSNLFVVKQTGKKLEKYNRLDSNNNIDIKVLKIYKQGDILLNEYIEQVKAENKFTAQFVLNLIQQINVALIELHKQGIIHVDIKPENLRVKFHKDGSFNIQIIDYGSSFTHAELDAKRMEQEKAIEDDKLTVIEVKGTHPYIAPEAYEVKDYTDKISMTYYRHPHSGTIPGYNAEINEAADVFSMGASLYHMILDQFVPRNDQAEGPTKAQVTLKPEAKSQLRSQIKNKLEDDSKAKGSNQRVCTNTEASLISNLLMDMLENDPTKRITTDEISYTLITQHLASNSNKSKHQKINKKIDQKILALQKRTPFLFKKGSDKVKAFYELKDLLKVIIASVYYMGVSFNEFESLMPNNIYIVNQLGFIKDEKILDQDDYNKLVKEKLNTLFNRFNAKLSRFGIGEGEEKSGKLADSAIQFIEILKEFNQLFPSDAIRSWLEDKNKELHLRDEQRTHKPKN